MEKREMSAVHSTELDELPADWLVMAIRDVGEVVTGRTPSTKREDFYGGDYNLISPADLDNGKYVVTAHRRLTKVGFMECRALPKDSVLVGCIGNVGKLGMVADERSATNQQINAVICNESHDPHFIYYCVYGNRARLEQVADKTTLPILNKTNFENFEIAIPPLPEQQKIAAVLGLVQLAIEQQERLIALTAELKKALLHQLFAYGLCGEPQKQTEIGPVPESWNPTQLGKCCDIVSGSLSYTDFLKMSSVDDEDAVECMGVKVSDMNLLGNENKFVTANAVRRIPVVTAHGKLIPPKTIVFPKRGAAIATNKKRLTTTWTVLDPNLIGVCAKKSLDADFLFYWVQTFDLRTITDPGPTPQLNKKDLISVLMPLPKEIDEQRDIANVISVAERKLTLYKSKLAVLTDLFHTLLHQLMTAQIRVHELDMSEFEVMK